MQSMNQNRSELSIKGIIPKKRIYTVINGYLIASAGYNIYKSSDLGVSWDYCNKIPTNPVNYLLSKNRSINRLSRGGIHQIMQLNDDKVIIYCNRDMFLTNSSFLEFEKVEIPLRSFQVLDHSICVTPKYVYYGEYFPNIKRTQVNIFRTSDGLNWEKIYSFKKSSIKHIHLLQYDQFLKKLWFSTGDNNNECILGYANCDFSEIEIVGENSQLFRCLEIMFDREKVYWGTDNPKGQNWLLSLNRSDHKLKKITMIDGPVYNLKKLKNIFILVTANEGGMGEWDNRAHVWYSTNPERGKWKDTISFEKDCWPYLFGFGRLIYGVDIDNYIFFHGLALKGLDNNTIVLKIDI